MSQMEYAGIVLDLDADVLTDDIRAALREGRYERQETECVELYLDADDDVVELGGGIGYLACYVDQRLDDHRRHVVVEPNASLLPLAERHRELNDASFELVSAAYAPDGRLAELPLSEQFWEASLQQDSETARSLYTGTTDLETLLDTFDLTDVVLVVDIEGGEAGLIENELDVLLSRCRLLVVEYHYDDVPLDLAEAVRWAKGRLDTSAFELVDEKKTVAVYRSPEA